MKKTGFFTLFFIFLCIGLWAVDYTWTGGDGSDTYWTNKDNWYDGSSPSAEYPGENEINDTVTIEGSGLSVILDNDVTLSSLTIDGAELDLSTFSLTVDTLIIKNNANISSLSATNLIVNTLFEVDSTTFDLDGCLLTVGSVRLVNGADLTGDLNADNVTIDYLSELTGTISFSGGGDLEIVSGTVSITGNVDIEFGNLDLDSRYVNITQTGIGRITQKPSTVIKTSRTLSLSAEGTIELTENNEVEKLNITKADGAVEFTNKVAFEVIGVTADDDVTLTIGASASTDSITINGNFSAKDLTFEPGIGGVLVGNADVDISGDFSTDNKKLTLAGSIASGIKAVNVYAGSIDVTSAAVVTINATNITTDSIDVTSAAIINIDVGNITTTGNQNYGNGTLTLTGTTVFTATGGSITAGGKVTGTDVTANALTGISFTNAANVLDGNITLNNTQTGTASGNITFTNTSTPDSLTAKNNTTNGNITIKQTGNLPIDLLQTTGANGNILIEVTGEVTQTGVITTSDLTVKAGTGITLNSTNAVTTSVELTSTAGNIEFINARVSVGDLTVKAKANNGDITIKENAGGLIVDGIDAAGNTVSLDAAGDITQTPDTEIKADTLKVGTSANITLALINKVTASVDFTSTGNIEFTNRLTSAGNLSVKTDTQGNITIKEEFGGLNVDQITSGANIRLKSNTDDIQTQKITVSGSIILEAGKDITVTDAISFSPITANNTVTLEAGGKITVTDVNAYQLIAVAVGIVTVNTVTIETNDGIEDRDAAIYIEAHNFIVTALSPNSIVPGGQGGQLCLNLYEKWKDDDNVVDGPEDTFPTGTVDDARWHQHYVDLTKKHLVYGDGTVPAGLTNYVQVLNNGIKTIFVLDPGYNIYIYNADITSYNNTGLIFETSGSGFIQLDGTNRFTKLELKTESGDINLQGIDGILSDFTVVTTAGTIKINQDIETTETQEYLGKVALINDVALTLNSVSESITLGNITGNGKSLTINGKGFLNGGNGINDLSVNGDFNLVSGTISAATVYVTGISDIAGNITTTGDQTYTGVVTLDGNVTLTSTAGLVTLGHITGNGKTLTVSGNGVLNGGTDINILSVSGTTTINEDITTAGTQTYSGTVTLGDNITLTSTAGSITLGAVTGNGKSLTIDGNGVLNGGINIENLSITKDFSLVSGTLSAATIDVTEISNIAGNITTTGNQTYSETVTLGDDITLTSTAGLVTLGNITGSGKSLTITGNGVLNGGSGINDLSVSGNFSLASGSLSAATVDVTGTSNIAGNITTTGDQTYTGMATLGGTSKWKIESQNGDIEFKNTLTSVNEIELSVLSGKITITGQTTAKQLLAKAPNGTVSVNEITTTSTGNEGEDAAIHIVANNFIVTTTTPNSIIPGGIGGQLCLNLNIKWVDTNGVVDGPEDTIPTGTVAGARWHQHFMVLGKILYCFTEDSNGNGKLDRIRVQTNKELLGNFTDFDVSVVGYNVVKFEIVKDNNDSFYIYLEEKVEYDGDKTPQWSITKNTSLIDATGKPMSDQDEMKYIDTIPPRIVYTLTLPGNPQTYVLISEPVQSLSGGNISTGNISFDGSPATAVKEMDLGYLFDYSTSYKTEDMAKLNDIDSALSVGYFQMNNIVDKGKKPDEIDTNYPPKYPVDWSYTAYAKEEDNSNVLIPPNNLLGVLAKSNNDPVTRRVTDVLVSLSPNNYFVWPVWAKPSDDNNSIMEFDGTKYLEKKSIEKSGIGLQARIGNNLSIVPQLYWTMEDISANMRNPKEASEGKKVGGLWLPNALTNPLYCYVPLSNGINQTPSAANSSSLLFNYNIPTNDLANSGAKFEFIFRSSNTSDLFVARLDAPPGIIPSNWYALIRPFSFDIHSVRLQRGGVTLMNNVINSDKKEIAYIRYNLPRSGRVTIQIYTLDGTLIKSIRRNEQRDAGTYVDTWDGFNNGGRAVARGMYFVRVVGPDIDEIRKIMVVK